MFQLWVFKNPGSVTWSFFGDILLRKTRCSWKTIICDCSPDIWLSWMS